MEQQYLLSLILPAYNEEKRLPECMDKVADFVASHTEPIEVIIVENGSKDRTYEMACEYASRYPWLTVLKELTPGKGNAVRRGMLDAHGKCPSVRSIILFLRHWKAIMSLSGPVK